MPTSKLEDTHTRKRRRKGMHKMRTAIKEENSGMRDFSMIYKDESSFYDDTLTPSFFLKIFVEVNCIKADAVLNLILNQRSAHKSAAAAFNQLPRLKRGVVAAVTASGKT
ncbi:GL17942 [Drosophila persimilis]|uniref:GL17942 n=1 Tax=Drosophila persimilis TaxID=7234 RepID=B4H1S9_DROPE|nr:GL17942 [Drosophila persimilis]